MREHECLSPKEAATAAQMAVRRAGLGRHQRYPMAKDDGEIVLNKGQFIAGIALNLLFREMERGRFKECPFHPGRYTQEEVR